MKYRNTPSAVQGDKQSPYKAPNCTRLEYMARQLADRSKERTRDRALFWERWAAKKAAAPKSAPPVAPKDDKAPAAPGQAAAAPVAGTPDPVPQQAHEDACLSDSPLAAADITPDESLPAASGGVAREQQGGAP